MEGSQMKVYGVIALLEVAAGVASHLLYYKHGEHHMNALVLLYSYAGLVSTVWICELEAAGFAHYRAVQNTFLHVFVYSLSLFTSIAIYRAYFHRLRSFPGPFLAGVSKFWHVYQVRHSRNHQLLLELHRQYGPFVRTGPSEITAFVPEAIAAVNASQNNCTKPAWYDLLQPLRGLISIRDKREHDWRRRVWDRGFNLKALQCYDNRILKYGGQLEEHLARTTGQPVLVNDWFYWFSFDVMGDLTLAKPFGMLIEKKWHRSILMMRDAMWLLGPFSPTPWLARIGFGIPGLAQGWKAWVIWCRERMSERMSVEPENLDVSFQLIKASQESGSLERDRQWLDGDAVALIIAGSDSVAITLTCVFYQLARFPVYQKLISEEISKDVLIHDIQSLQKLPALQSVIMETLRLFPPVLTGAPRESGPDGITIRGQYIPPYTTIVTPSYVLARLEDAFVQAEDFIPERWTSKPEMVLDKRAFEPFSQGRYSCVGKNLALREISYLVANLLSKYEVSFAPGEDGLRVEGDMRDEFTAVPGKLELVFKSRGG